MSIGNGFIYVQFHPLVYGIKLHIEMNLADLIAKSVRGENNSNDVGGYYHHASTDGARTGGTAARRTGNNNNNHDGPHHGASDMRMHTLVTVNRRDAADDEHDIEGKGIHRTVETRVVHEHKDDDAVSRTSSTDELQKKFGIV